jgi:hypothetical protein
MLGLDFHKSLDFHNSSTLAENIQLFSNHALDGNCTLQQVVIQLLYSHNGSIDDELSTIATGIVSCGNGWKCSYINVCGSNHRRVRSSNLRDISVAPKVALNWIQNNTATTFKNWTASVVSYGIIAVNCGVVYRKTCELIAQDMTPVNATIIFELLQLNIVPICI